MSIHSLLEQSRRNLAWRTCPTTTTATITTMIPAAETPAAAGQLLQAA